MPKTLHTGRLVLTPADPYFLPDDLSAITTRLEEIGFIGTALSGRQDSYLLGEHFMQLVTFMGCSPYIRLEPGAADEAFCHLKIDPTSAHPRLLTGKNTTPPRCTVCRRRISDWRTNIARWQQQPDWLASCPHCGHRQDPATYDFRQSAGFGRLFLCVEQIFPHEAIPSPSLLTHLQQASGGTSWHFFFVQEEIPDDSHPTALKSQDGPP